MRPAAATLIEDHPLVTKLGKSIALGADDLAALGRLLERRITVKKAKDIIVEGYEYKVLHVVESGFAIRYKLLHTGKRQIVNIIMPGDIIGFPACFYEYAIFSVTALGEMSLHPVPLDHFTDVCLTRATVSTALLWFAAREAAMYAEHIIDSGRREPRRARTLPSGDANAPPGDRQRLHPFLRHAAVPGRDRRRHRAQRASRQSYACRAAARRTDRHERAGDKDPRSCCASDPR